MMYIRLYSSILVITLLLIGCDAPENQSVDTQKTPRPVKLYLVKDEANESLRSFPATVEANLGAHLTFRVNGELKSFNVKPGQDVKKGELLAVLDDEDFKIRLSDRAARLELAKSQFQRAKTLVEKNLAANSQFDEAKANLLIAEAEFQKAEQDLHYTELRAPYSGSISKVYVKNRENIVAKQNILDLLNRDLMDVSIQVPEKIIATVKKDSNYKPTVTFDSLPNTHYPLEIKEWDTQADPVTLTYKVVFSLPSPTEINVLPGMSANVHIDLNKIRRNAEQGIWVPATAVFVAENTPVEKGQAHVWKYNAATYGVDLVLIKLGTMKGDRVQVIEGIQIGDAIVSAGVHSIDENSLVTPWVKERGI